MSDYRDQLSFETDHDASPVDADRALAAFLLSYVARRNAGSSDGEATPLPTERSSTEDPTDGM